MALEAPLRSSTGSIYSAFSTHADMSLSSPDSPALYQHFRPMSSASSAEASSLRPPSAAASRSSAANNHIMSPSDIVGPSPVTSVGTEVTEIEDEPSEETKLESTNPQTIPQSQLMMLRTNLPENVRHPSSEEAVSVIHAPESFQSWTSSNSTIQRSETSSQGEVASNLSADNEQMSLPTPNDHPLKSRSPGVPTPPPIQTDVKPAKFSLESATPQAQNLQEIISDARLRSSSTTNLELIPETGEPETDVEHEPEADGEDDFVSSVSRQEAAEIKSLRTALAELWTLCNTLATLSTHHRERVFNSSGTPNGHERAWICCWKLCQQLYDNQDAADESFNMTVNIDLCRDFCQALFDVRQRKDELADSVLRVSFELNNHLYSAQDNKNLPEAFRERTLDFYITLCHRLMKQRNEPAEETDSLLTACWSLAEMLFSLRQNFREGRSPDEELLGSAVQACWDLCDIFREGWTQVRPDRNTPRPTQTTFFSYQHSEASTDGRASRASNRSKPKSIKNAPQEKVRKPPPVPDTPVTEFEDTPLSPDAESPSVPNILVLGTESNRGGRWSSSASNLSGYSQSSQKTSSTATTTTTVDDVNTTRVKILVLKAAMNVGFSRDEAAGGHTGAALQVFVKALPTGSFGSLPAHATLLQNYKNLVTSDSAFRQLATLPSRGKRVHAGDVAKSVGWMMHRSSQYNFLRDLFKLVFGFHIEDADGRKNVSIAV